MSDPSTEALAQAREQPDVHEVGPAIDLLIAAGFVVVHRSKLGSERACRGEMRTIAARKELEAERATVIELRRQLAEKDEDFEEGARERDALRTELATERQRAEAAERSRDEWRESSNIWERNRNDRCRERDTFERLYAASEKRAEAAEREVSEWVNWFQQRDPAKAYDIIANEHDAIRSARDQWHRDYCQASEERSDYQGKLAASEAKRKALREALLDVGQIVIQMRIPTVEESASGHERALREKGEVHTIWTKALAADGKDTPA